MKLKKADIKPVVRRPINLSEFFLIFEMFINKKIGRAINEFQGNCEKLRFKGDWKLKLGVNN